MKKKTHSASAVATRAPITPIIVANQVGATLAKATAPTINTKIDISQPTTAAVKEAKIQAVREDRTFSEIVEQVLREYLDRQMKVKVKSKSK